MRFGPLVLTGSLAHLQAELRPSHGPQVWPWWLLVSFSLVELNAHLPRGQKTLLGWRLWIYSRWGAIHLDAYGRIGAGAQLAASMCRSLYLLTLGMWRGERAIDTYDAAGLKALQTGRWSDNRRTYRIWWSRQ